MFEYEENRGPDHYGIWTEYPFVLSMGATMVWDEADSRWVDRPPTFDELYRMYKPPKCIADIAVQCKGMISHIIEVVHKNPPNQEKLDYLHEITTGDVWVVPATWVMNQIQRPRAWPVTGIYL